MAYAGAYYQDETTATASAYLDPIFTFTNDLDASQYQLVFSPSTGDSPATTPLPAALPLFATGLGGLGFFSWRRRRRATAAAN